MTFRRAYGLGFGLAFGAMNGVLIVDVVRDWRKAAPETERFEIVVQPELWTYPDYESYRHWKAHGGNV